MPRRTTGSGEDNESGVPCNCDEEEGVLDFPGVSECKSEGKAETKVNTKPATVRTAVMMAANVAEITFKILNIQAVVISNATMTMVHRKSISKGKMVEIGGVRVIKEK